MTTKRRVYYKPSGEVVIVIPAPNSQRQGEDEAAWLTRVYEKTIHHIDGLPFDDIEQTDLPDRTERDKWRGSQGNGVHIDPTVNTIQDENKAGRDALGTRAELMQEINDLANAAPPLKSILRKLARVIYNREKNTID